MNTITNGSQADILAALKASDSEYVLLHPAGSEPDSARIEQVTSQTGGSEVFVAAADPEAFEFGAACENLGTMLGVLWTTPSQDYVVARRERLTGPAGLRAVDDPVWDWTIRQVAAGGSLAVEPTAPPWPTLDADEQTRRRLAPCEPGRSRRWLLEHLQSVDDGQLVSRVGSRDDMTALRAAILQRHDYLDLSHQQSQSIEGCGTNQAGDYWHGIMHRREPDESNACYWFRRVGRHEIFAALANAARAILEASPADDAREWADRIAGDGWDAAAFARMCTVCRQNGDAALTEAAERIQHAEMQLLTVSTRADATG